MPLLGTLGGGSLKNFGLSVPTIYLFSRTVGAVNSFVIPNNVQSTDFMLLVNIALNVAGFPTAVVPTGFTQILNITSGLSGTAPRRHIISYKKLAPSDAGQTVTLMNGDNNNHYVHLIFRTKASSVSVSGLVSTATDANPDPLTILAPSNNLDNVAIGYFRGTAPNTFSFSPDADGNTFDLDAERFFAYKFYKGSAAQTVTIDKNDSGNGNTVAGFYLTFQ